VKKRAVLVVGAGGLGVPAIIALGACGRFALGLVDPERVELSNLARQVIYGARHIDMYKVEAAARYLRERFGLRDVKPMSMAVGTSNAAELVVRYDFVIDATDDPTVKFLLNDVCVAAQRPFCYGGVLGFRGQAMTVLAPGTACLRCLFENPPEAGETASCRDAGIVGPVAGLIGFVQAREAITCLDGRRPRLAGRLFTYDALGRASAKILPVRPRDDCTCAAARLALGRSSARAFAGATRLDA
jgi:molybdopterin/thiamine biosynthesis adenylyltransferase